MKRYFFLFLIFLILAPATAQDEAPLPVLHAEDIFAEGVTVLERLPVVRANNETRELYYLAPDATQWETYSYPDGIQKELQYRWEMRSRAYIFSEGIIYGLNPPDSLADWFFTPSLGLSLIERQCNLEFVSAESYGFWVLEATENAEYRLCNTGTGERTPILNIPDFVTKQYCGNLTAKEGTNVSPNGDWIVFAGCQDAWNIYAYHIPSKTVNFLGSVNRGSQAHLFISRWYSNTEFFIANATGGSSVMASISYYFVDVSRANSVIYAGDFPYNETIKRSIGIISVDYPFNYAVQSFNPETREIEILTEFECRIELCYQSYVVVSNDLRYVAVAEDVPFANELGVLFVYDRIQDDIVYERHLDDTDSLSQMYWTFDNHLFLGDWTESQTNSNNDTHLSLFDYLNQSFNLVIDNIDGLDFSVSPDNRYALYHNQDGAWMAFIFESAQSYPIFAPEQCLSARLKWQADYIEVFCGNNWHIRIDALNEGQS